MLGVFRCLINQQKRAYCCSAVQMLTLSGGVTWS